MKDDELKRRVAILVPHIFSPQFKSDAFDSLKESVGAKADTLPIHMQATVSKRLTETLEILASEVNDYVYIAAEELAGGYTDVEFHILQNMLADRDSRAVLLKEHRIHHIMCDSFATMIREKVDELSANLKVQLAKDFPETSNGPKSPDWVAEVLEEARREEEAAKDRGV